MECAEGSLGPAPAAVEEGPAAVGPVAAVGTATTMSAAEDPAVAGEGPAVGGEGPWPTHGLKSVSSSRLCHLRTLGRATREEAMKFSETEMMICEVKMKWNKGL